MSTVYVIIRTIGEKTFPECRKAVSERFGEYGFSVLENYKPLEKASKECIRIGAELSNNYDWILVVDADVILEMSKEDINDYAQVMKEMYEDTLFTVTCYLDCTKRGLIDGMHLFRTSYCRQVYDYVKDKSFDFHIGREEYEICQMAKHELGFPGKAGYTRISFGKHIFEAQLKSKE